MRIPPLLVGCLSVLVATHSFGIEEVVLPLGRTLTLKKDGKLLEGKTIKMEGGILLGDVGDKPRVFTQGLRLNGNANIRGTTPFVFSTEKGGKVELLSPTWMHLEAPSLILEQPVEGKHDLVKGGGGTLWIKGEAELGNVTIVGGNLRVDGVLRANRLVLVGAGTLSGSGKLEVPEIIAPGRESEMEYPFHFQKEEVMLYVYRPKSYKGEAMMVLMPGSDRRGAAYRRTGKGIADQLGMLLVVPEFDRERWINDQYSYGGVRKGRAVQAREAWTFSAIPKLVEEVRKREGKELPYYLVGHSAGGQFTSRYAALMPPGPERIVVVNGGSVMFPTREIQFPFGFGGLPDELSNDEMIKRFLAAPLSIFYGTADTKVGGYPDEAEPNKQGVTRIERGRNLYAAGRKVAEEKGWPFNWQLVLAEGAEHDSTQMWCDPQAAKAILGK